MSRRGILGCIGNENNFKRLAEYLKTSSSSIFVVVSECVNPGGGALGRVHEEGVT
jgi:hypothetical protein